MHLPYLHQYIKANFDNILKERGVITIKLTPQSPRKEETDNEGMFHIIGFTLRDNKKEKLISFWLNL